MHMRVVVADQSEARFYDTGSLHAPLQLAGTLTDPKAHLHERDLVADRPGRVFDARKHEAASFARQIVAALEVAIRQRHVDRIVLMAAPGFLGLLRAELPHSVQKAVVAEVHKDLVHQPDEVVRGHLPREAFADLPAPG
jgi:protein required for attachment to host cells